MSEHDEFKITGPRLVATQYVTPADVDSLLGYVLAIDDLLKRAAEDNTSEIGILRKYVDLSVERHLIWAR